MANDPNETGAKIKAARLDRGWTQKALSDRTGVTQQAIARIEAGAHSRHTPSLVAALGLKTVGERGAPVITERAVIDCLTLYVRTHGKREGLLDALLPAERQDEAIARAMGLIEYLSQEDSADA